VSLDGEFLDGEFLDVEFLEGEFLDGENPRSQFIHSPLDSPLYIIK
jgi:hypothetical protein